MSSPVALITGAGGAVAGEAIAVFKQAGWRLALVVRGEAARARLAAAHPGAVIAVADLTDAVATRAAVDALAKDCGQVDALLNIAGGFAMAGALEETPAGLEAQLAINLRTAVNATQAALPHMLAAGAGFVLGVGAGQALDGGAQCGAYAASKAALVAWLKSMHAEFAAKGIAMAMLYPMGAIDTAGNRAAMPNADPAGWIDPRELAETMLHLATRGTRARIREAKVYPRG